MRLLAAMRLDLFQTFEETLRIGLKRMELCETYDADPAAGAVPEKKSGWAIPIATLAAGLLTGLIGTKAYDAVREPSEVIIDLPPGHEGAAETQSREATISWTYKKPHLLGPPAIDGNHEAIVNVTRLRDNHPILHDERHLGNASLAGLDDGSYFIKIDAGESYKTLVLTVKSKAEPVPQPNAANPAVPRPRGASHPES
jgi:hypothetical protein